MVHIAIQPTKGNAGSRQFPYSGYLGLTPVKVEGVVHTVCDADAKLLPAKSLVVAIRCYETRVGRVGTLLPPICLAEYPQTLWEKPGGVDYADLGDAQFPFKLTVPPATTGHGTVLFQEYRLFWRLEAIVTHVPMVGVGSRLVKYFDLPLVRYDIPPLDPTHPLPSYLTPFSETRKQRAPVVRYRVLTPNTWIGPADLVSIPLALQPLHPDLVVRAASLIVERRIELHDEKTSSITRAPSASATSSSNPPVPPRTGSHSPSASTSFQARSTPSPTGLYTPNLSRSSSASATSASMSCATSPTSTVQDATASTQSFTPLLQNSPALGAGSSEPTSTRSRTIVSSIAAVESMGPFTRDAEGLCTKMLTLQWPEPKSSARWAIGHTMRTDLICVRFFARAKIIVSNAQGTDSLDLDERELFVLPTNDAERRVAMAKYADARARSKSKSPRRASGSKGDSSSRSNANNSGNPLPSPPLSPSSPDPNIPPVPIVPLSATMSKSTPVGASGSISTYRPGTSSGSKPTGTSTRRPHTSAGPRDKTALFGLRPNTNSTTASTATGIGTGHALSPDSAVRIGSSSPSNTISLSKFRREGRDRDRKAPPSSVLAYLPPQAQQAHEHADVDRAPFLVSPANAMSISGRRSRDSALNIGGPQGLSISPGSINSVHSGSSGLKGIAVDVEVGAPRAASLESEQVLAWEAELSRMEAKASQSSASMLRFKRSNRGSEGESSSPAV